MEAAMVMNREDGGRDKWKGGGYPWGLENWDKGKSQESMRVTLGKTSNRGIVTPTQPQTFRPTIYSVYKMCRGKRWSRI